ncbi:MAG: hypothetical protein JWM08_2227 [Candidatus Angelobacter sp.]|nr:hypothetical protein [Candidatus Angelobacter sp.]
MTNKSYLLAIFCCYQVTSLYAGGRSIRKAFDVIDHTVEAAAANEEAERYITLRLKKKATVHNVVWELSALLPDVPVQQ